VASSGGRPCWAYAVIRQREHLDTGAHGPIPDALAATVAGVVDQNVFCYLGLPEQIHTDQGAQFKFQLIGDHGYGR